MNPSYCGDTRTNPNYTVTKTDAVLTVTPKAVTVVATDKSKVYGDVNPTLTQRQQVL
jgi:hypothetical protein